MNEIGNVSEDKALFEIFNRGFLHSLMRVYKTKFLRNKLSPNVKEYILQQNGYEKVQDSVWKQTGNKTFPKWKMGLVKGVNLLSTKPKQNDLDEE